MTAGGTRTSPLRCTVRTCGERLDRDARGFVCARGHRYDVAKSGYVNLLQPQDRKSRRAGDAPETVAARRRFLETGAESFVVDAAVALVSNGPMGAGPMLDVGCGEGTITAALAAALDVPAWGVDLSTRAIEIAARRWPSIGWVVANADRALPFVDASFELVVSITARRNAGEMRRVLASDGRLVVVVPGARDMAELREAVLGDAVERDRSARVVAELEGAFALERRETVERNFTLEGQTLADGLASTYRLGRGDRADRAAALDAVETTLARDLLLFRPLDLAG